MRWASASGEGDDLDGLLEDVLGRVRAALPEGRADLAFVFLARAHRSQAPEVPRRVRAALGRPHVLGATSRGVIGTGREYEQEPAVSVLAGRLPDAAVHGFHLLDGDLPGPDEPPGAWHAALGTSPLDAPAFLLLADPFSFDTASLLAGLDFAWPGTTAVGGLASGGRRAGEQVLFHQDRAVGRGAVGVALLGDVEVQPAVAQGCRALGEPLRITRCDGRRLHEVDGQPVLEALQAILQDATEQDRQLARTALFLGFETAPLSDAEDEPWLIRNLLGVDPGTRALYVGEPLRRGRRVRFHLRDRQASHQDLEQTLGAAARAAASPAGALLFTCLGRGRGLYGEPDHDARAFARHFAGVPLAGAFCNGEIGPLGRTTHLHGYTSSFALLRSRNAALDDA